MTFDTAATRFSVFQTVRELRQIARNASHGTRKRILGQMPVFADVEDLDQLIEAQGCRFRPEQVGEMHPPLLLAAVLPQEDYEAFITSTAILLADRLQHGAGPDSLEDHWDAVADHYGTAPRPVACALRRGFALAHALTLVRLAAPPKQAEMVTDDRETVLANLRDLARGMKVEEINIVSCRDRNGARARHATALRHVLSDAECLLPEADRWFPTEVVELSSHRPGPGFAACTALVLIESILRDDRPGNAGLRWAAAAQFYSDLPSEPRQVLLQGYRHLWETHPDWDPYEAWTDWQIETQAIAFPFGPA